ncbi:type VI secretion system baseplate subunit TssK [Thalassomonas viridans]|uniref:Type VI secretion system baseplate subunit TssK n=1 Tax=Thalassomonas viridans TaxID=137584 RepID=A0AAF0C7I1_9GAMM|nr:type VI secretion system baseplate subunit TssK [Thalassomonas viridans]WDE02879.1 type VI secretion system baseplate subunit TssK [Thalassomonas viridans]
MPGQKRVVWTEGMLMLPQHFQQQTRYFEQLIQRQHYHYEYPMWGVAELEIDTALLNAGKISLVRASGFFPDGSFFELPERDKLPAALDITGQDRGQIIYLCLYVFHTNNSEVNRDQQKAGYCRYLLEEIALRDISCEHAEKNHVEVCALNLRLLREKDDRAEYLYIPLARVQEVKGDGSVVLSHEFIASTINIKRSAYMDSVLKELESVARHRAGAIAGRICVEGKAVASEVSDFLMLQCLNRYLPRLGHVSCQACIHPYSLFLLFIEIIGEFSTFTRAGKLAPDLPDYNHYELTECFSVLIGELKTAFSTVLEQRSVNIPLEDRSYGVNVGKIPDKQLLANSAFVLAVSADMGLDELRKFFPGQVKIGAVEEIKELVNVQLPGIQINSLAVAPRQIPYQKGTVYFELVQQGQYWQSLETSGGIAIHVGRKFPNLKLELWAVRAG